MLGGETPKMRKGYLAKVLALLLERNWLCAVDNEAVVMPR